eukprot:603659-Rhodomonas_salina.3
MRGGCGGARSALLCSAPLLEHARAERERGEEEEEDVSLLAAVCNLRSLCLVPCRSSLLDRL